MAKVERILIIGDDRDHFNGWSTMTRGLSTGFINIGVEVDIIEASNDLRENSSKLRSLRKSTLINHLTDYFKILIKIKKFDPDLIIIIPEHFALHVYLMKVFNVANYAVYNAGTYSMQMIKAPGFKRNALKFSKCNFVMSEYTRARMLEYIPNASFKVVHAGIDEETFYPSENIKEKSIVFNGNLKKRKGFTVLVDALKQLGNEKCRLITLTMVGTYKQEQQDEVQRLLSRVDITINFTGKIDVGELANIYRKAALNVLISQSEPFYFEGFGLIHSEAIACGTMTVGALHSGNECAIQPGDGYLIDPDDYNALAGIIDDQLFKNEIKRAKIRSIHTWEQVAKRFL